MPPYAAKRSSLSRDLQLAALRLACEAATDAECVLEACHAGDDAWLKRLLVAGATAEARSGDGQTPLMVAVVAQNVRCVSMLVALGVDVNARDEAGTTALHLAAALGDLCMLGLLCTSPNIDLEAKLHTHDGYTAHDVARFAQMPDAAAFLAARRRFGPCPR